VGAREKPTSAGKTLQRKPNLESKSRWLLSEVTTEQHFSLTYGTAYGYQLCADLHEQDLALGGERSAITRSPQTSSTLLLRYKGGGREELPFQT